MPNSRVPITAILALIAGVAPSIASAQIAANRERNAPSAYAITNARIVTGAGAAVDRGTIVVRNGVIVAVGASVQAPADARVIDGNGLTVYPGIIDANSSLALGGGAPDVVADAPDAAGEAVVEARRQRSRARPPARRTRCTRSAFSRS